MKKCRERKRRRRRVKRVEEEKWRGEKGRRIVERRKGRGREEGKRERRGGG